MKYLIVILLFIFCSPRLSAQDTLYIRGERKPLIVNITIVKKKSLNYVKGEGLLVRTVRMKNVKKIKFFNNAQATTTQNTNTQEKRYSSPDPIKVYPDFDEFQSTISANSIGTSRYYAGLNYLHHLSGIQSASGRHNFFANIGGGYYNRSTPFSLGDLELLNRAKGYYLEFGARMEICSKQNPKNRLHIGLDVNNRWVERITARLFESVVEVSDVNEFAVQVPIGYTFRSPSGFYLNTGLEVTTEKAFPACHIGIGVSFGK